jgi:LPXTG-motif cell wall-anchored protein
MRSRTALLALPAALTFALVGSGSAFAADSITTQADLEVLNNSGATGTAMLMLDGDRLTVKIHSTGLVPNAPHAQHIHGTPDGQTDFRCPDDNMSLDKNNDGIINVVEGATVYGPINISLTTKGDTSDKSGLAVDRMPVADAKGEIDYQRTITVGKDVQENLKNLHVVQHGIDVNKNGKYDFEAGKSELDPKLPQEATAPANCGAIAGSTMGAVPAGGVETGSGSTGGTESPALLGFGAAAMAAAGGLVVAARRRRSFES